MSKDAIETPFQNPHRRTMGLKDDTDDVYDHNSTPQFSKPHDMGKDTIPCVFEEGELGKSYRGPVDTNAAILSTTMSGVSKKS